MLEALILGFLATSLGGLAGAGLALALDAAQVRVGVEAVSAVLMSDRIHLVVEPARVALAVLGFTAVAGLSALAPALRAARLQPVTAMHHVG